MKVIGNLSLLVFAALTFSVSAGEFSLSNFITEMHSDGYRCVATCSGRSSNGTCYSYGKDSCGYNMNCVAHCTGRSSNGSCYSYSSDFCGENANCTVKCEGRSSDGTCYSYGQDVCESREGCYPSRR